MLYDPHASFPIVDDVHVETTSSKPIVLVLLFWPRLFAGSLELDEKQAMVRGNEQPIGRVALMELEHEATQIAGPSDECALER